MFVLLLAFFVANLTKLVAFSQSMLTAWLSHGEFCPINKHLIYFNLNTINQMIDDAVFDILLSGFFLMKSQETNFRIYIVSHASSS